MKLNTILAPALSIALSFALTFAGNAVAAPDRGLGMSLMSALVEEDGTLFSGAGAVSSSKDSNHSYAVKFDRSLAHCAAAVTPVFPNTIASAFVSAASRTVQVKIRANGSAAPDTSNFHLFVFCPR